MSEDWPEVVKPKPAPLQLTTDEEHRQAWREMLFLSGIIVLLFGLGASLV